MIEIIYDKNKEDKRGRDEEVASSSQDERDTSTDNQVSIGLKLPKNIRQIGSPSGNKRIYIEDYVVTYLNYIARPGSTHARGAILLGESKRSDVGEVIFISGAVDAQNIEFDMDESEFTQEAWSKIYEDVKEFFPGLSVVGWFLSRMGFSTAINSKIEKMHVENFPGKDKVLYVSDSLESDDAFYMYEKGQLVKQRGYYIYYAKNEAMQNYIIKQKGGITTEEDSEIHRKDEELIKNYREKNKNATPSKGSGISLLYVASSFVVLAMLAMGITVISNYDKMKEMEVSINRLELTADSTDEDYAQVMAQEDSGTNDSDEVDENADLNTTETDTTEPQITSSPSDAEHITTEQTLPAMTDEIPQYYKVEYGDSLSSIALNNYGSVEFASEIAAANNMDVDDKIYEGQQLVLPVIEESN